MRRFVWMVVLLIVPGFLMAQSAGSPPRLEVSSFVSAGSNTWVGLLVGEKQQACILKVGQEKLGVRLERIDYPAGEARVEYQGEHYVLYLRTPASKEMKLAEVPKRTAQDLSIDLEELVREFPDAVIKVPVEEVPVETVTEVLGLNYDQNPEAPADEEAFRKNMESRGIRVATPSQSVPPPIPEPAKSGTEADQPVLDADPAPRDPGESEPQAPEETEPGEPSP